MKKRRVLVLCPTDWDKEALSAPGLSNRYEFLFAADELLETPTLWQALRFDFFAYARRLVRTYAGAQLDGVVGTNDYPACMLAPAVASELGLPCPALRDVVLLCHKFYSRQIQARVVPEATPRFEAIDPYRPLAWRRLHYPMFVKPVKGTMSIRAALVNSDADLRRLLRFTWRQRIGAHLLLRPFQQMLRRLSDREVPAHCFIGEEPLKGAQVTVDGFVDHGRVVVMGVVDSVMYPGTNSFMRFDYPSYLPEAVQARMAGLAERLVRGCGFDNACFNIEMFYDAERDYISLIEINPRMSYQFADLYEKVDGVSTYEVQLALSTGQPVEWQRRQGRYGVASSFVLRRFADAQVVNVPNASDVAAVRGAFAGAVVKILCHAGDRLSAHDQDTQSFRYAIINLGAADTTKLHADFAAVGRLLPFAFDAPQAAASALAATAVSPARSTRP